MDDSKSTELEQERKYLDDARHCREVHRERLSDPAYAESGIDRASQRDIRKKADHELERMQPADSPAAFGRIDLDDDTAIYVGKQTIFDADRDILVLDWRRAEGRLFEQATAQDPCGLARKRTFTHERLVLMDFDDIIFADLQARVTELELAGETVDRSAPLVSDSLIEELDRARGGEMHDIVRTIQAAQSELIRSDMDRLLVVQGGPGTGKTAVALHRVSWMLFNYELDDSEVLVIGPNRTFLRYIEKVLPSLGNIRVPQADVLSLGAVTATAEPNEDDELLRLKGSAVMATVLERAVGNRVRVPDADLEWRAGGRRVLIGRDEIVTELDRFAALPYAERRGRFRAWLSERAAEYARGDVSVSQERVNRAVEQVMPNINARMLLADLYGSTNRLLDAAGEDLNGRQVQSLYRQSADRVSDEPWTPADVPLLDYAEHLISTQSVRRYRHIVVDEAQDLSPMQLKMIARRSVDGSITVVGDIAQSTGAFARSNWGEIAEHLVDKYPLVVGELRYGYRVPRQAFELAQTLLPYIAPDVSAPVVVRDGPEDPELLHAVDGNLVGLAVDAARRHAGSGRSVGLICPDVRREELEKELGRLGVQFTDASAGALGSAISLVSPVGSKGLEFDAVVVVDPGAIVTSGDDGYRLLYVALTRTTRYMSIVHTGTAVPTPGAGLSPAEADARPDAPGTIDDARTTPRRAAARVVDAAADGLLELLGELAPPAMWEAIVEALSRRVRSEHTRDAAGEKFAPDLEATPRPASRQWSVSSPVAADIDDIKKRYAVSEPQARAIAILAHELELQQPQTWSDVALVFLELVNDGYCLRLERDETEILGSTVGTVVGAAVSVAGAERQLGARPESLLRAVFNELDPRHHRNLAVVITYPNGQRAHPAIVHRNRATNLEPWTPKAGTPIT